MTLSLVDYFEFQGVKLTKLVPADIKPAVAMINHAYAYQDEAKGAKRTNEAKLAKQAAESGFYVAKHGGKLVGCVYIQERETDLHFGLLTVADAFRGTGLAQALMAAIEKYAIHNHNRALLLDYMSLAPWLKKYYERYGFAETGRVTPWGTIDLIQMKKDLA